MPTALTGNPSWLTKSLHIALNDLGLERAWIIYPGATSYPVPDRVEVLSIDDMQERLEFMAHARGHESHQDIRVTARRYGKHQRRAELTRLKIRVGQGNQDEIASLRGR